MSSNSHSLIFTDVTDADLVTQAQQGDAQAFDQLVTRYRGKVYGMCYQITHHEEDSWDLAQAAFIKAWRALPSFKGDSAFYTWIFRITHNVAYDWLRKRKIESSGEFNDELQSPIAAGALAVPHAHTAPDAAMDQQELALKINAAIDSLSPDHRTAILLREVEGHSYEEIASITHSTVGTVMSRLFYARKKLQEKLRDTYENVR